jgi:hypothetical protein
MESVEELRKLLEDLERKKVLKSGKEVLTEAFKELAVRYGYNSKEMARSILNSKLQGKLSDTVSAVRAEYDDLSRYERAREGVSR